MEYKSVEEIALLWNISSRSVRNYCNQGRVKGAIKKGKTWFIPENCIKPERKSRKAIPIQIASRLKFEKDEQVIGGIYHKTQIEFAFNSNHIEGSKLTQEQTRFIFETNTIGLEGIVNIDDIMETLNHFKCLDFVIDHYGEKLSEEMIKDLHYILKHNTSDEKKDWFQVGNYIKLENEVGGIDTTPAKSVGKEMKNLLKCYHQLKHVSLEDLLEFHYRFERIHPFQDGNGRVGRLILFKECLNHQIVPFVILDQYKYYYYRGLSFWENEKGCLLETCLAMQDQYKAYLDYFHIQYKED